MTASKRAAKELEDLQKDLPCFLRNLFSEDTDVLVWHALLLPELPPYNLKAFNLRINFPREYPLRPPTVIFTTPIYHPNVDLEGRVCLPIISNQHWNPRTKASRVLEDLNLLVNRLDLNEPMRLELAQQLKQTPELFYRRAEEHTLEFGEHRPS
ncbi:ubiquitin/ISG15-conjugating enzyme E2 L6 isoform X2 [Artibeus jamaicensis]|uniref:ubiquitin/ISG15-conjugating enzyme E2 L6 isoform X2 n=1 Tax=Artibeus jamaicensis TaxID=9417 RepID=UPI00235B187C|nr:ubiquitin/ISG15-conjugating enzyme E2 L6 isoform X2 [Artibeus jamaicensis]